MNMNIKY